MSSGFLRGKWKCNWLQETGGTLLELLSLGKCVPCFQFFYFEFNIYFNCLLSWASSVSQSPNKILFFFFYVRLCPN